MVVDIYHGDEVISFKPAKDKGIHGIIHKASEGATIRDHSYDARRQMAKDAGMLWGAYHFLRPGDMQAQVSHFIASAHPDGSTLLALDHEDPKVSLIAAIRFLELIEKQMGRKAVLYSGFLIKDQLGSRYDPYLAKHRLWLSHYNTHPSWPSTWDVPWLWQYTGDGVGPNPHNVPGIKGGKGIDMNSYAGTAEQLAAEWAS
jgi:GH25 family lysozyme M1 (1,4-beta-N-acetylmuramidase)